MRLKHFLSVFLTLLTLSVGQMWGADTQLYFEGWESNSHHRTSGNNDYGETAKTYGDFSFVYADAVSSGSPLTGSYHAILRHGKKCGQRTCSLTSGELLSDSYEIHTIKWNCKRGVAGQTLKVSYSTNGTSWTEGYNAELPSSKTERSISSLSITGPIYLKFEVSYNNSANSNYDANIDDITIEGVELTECEKIGAPSVTATTDNQTINLSWTDQTGASSYTVTRTPADGTVGTPSKSGNTWSCAITDLTNGTAYTWTVTPVGNGTTHCAEGNTAASASATPNVSRTITYYDKDGQHTTSLADGTNIATALNALYGVGGPTSCNTTDYNYFVGWKDGEISGTATSVTLLSTEIVNATTAAKSYYAVWSDTDPSAAGGWEVATSITVGDVVMLGYNASKQLSGISNTSTKYGLVANFPSGDADAAYPLTVCAGSSNGTFAFKNSNNSYLYWGSGNSLNVDATLNANTSWTFTYSAGTTTLANASDDTRKIKYNSNDTRFAAYTSAQNDISLYKRVSVSANYMTTCCEELGSINGSFSLPHPFGAFSLELFRPERP